MINRHKSLAEMTLEVQKWCEEKGWANDGRTFGDEMALLHSEISEAVEAFRIRGFDSWYTKEGKPEGVASEFADILVRLLDSCARHSIDLEKEYERKMAYNQKRPFRHGSKAL